MKWIEQKEQSAERCKIRGKKGGVGGRVAYAKIGRKNETEGRKRDISKVGIVAVVGKAGSGCRNDAIYCPLKMEGEKERQNPHPLPLDAAVP